MTDTKDITDKFQHWWNYMPEHSSASSIGNYLACQQMWVLRTVLRLEGQCPHPNLIIGKSIHALSDKLYSSGEISTPAQINDVVDWAIRDSTDALSLPSMTEDAQMIRTKVAAMWHAWSMTSEMATCRDEMEVLASEWAFDVDTDLSVTESNSLPLMRTAGRVDKVIAFKESGKLYAYEMKCTGRPELKDESVLALDAQALLYIYRLRKSAEFGRCDGMIYDVLPIPLLRLTPKDNGYDGLFVRMRTQLIEKFNEKSSVTVLDLPEPQSNVIDSLGITIERMEMSGKAKIAMNPAHCRAMGECAYRPLCVAGLSCSHPDRSPPMSVEMLKQYRHREPQAAVERIDDGNIE